MLPATFSVVLGELPPGLALEPSGLLHGVPTEAGKSSFTVEATSSGACGIRDYALWVIGT